MTGSPPVADVASYLDSTGWRPTGRTWRGAGIWSRRDAEVLLPVRDDLDDNPARVRDVLRVLADVEGRPMGEVARDLARPYLDAASFVGADASSMPLASAMPALQGLRDLLGTASRVALEGPHVRFAGPLPPPASGLLDRTRLVGSAPGFTLLMPVDSDEGLRGRDAAVVLHDAATAAAEAAWTRDPAAFDPTPVAGVSAEFCTALARLAGTGRLDPYSLVFRWAYRERSEVPAVDVGFPPGTGEIMRRAASRLRRLKVSGEATVRGRVDGQHDEAGSDDRWRVRIRGELDTAGPGGSRRAIWVRLPGKAPYDRAVEAYRIGRPVVASGELGSKEGRVELYTSAEGIEIVDDRNPEDERAR